MDAEPPIFDAPRPAEPPRLDVDVQCIGCGHNLRGLRPDGPCVECGQPIIWSLHAAGAVDGEPRWLSSLRSGVAWMSLSLPWMWLPVAWLPFVTGFVLFTRANPARNALDLSLMTLRVAMFLVVTGAVVLVAWSFAPPAWITLTATELLFYGLSIAGGLLLLLVIAAIWHQCRGRLGRMLWWELLILSLVGVGALALIGNGTRNAVVTGPFTLAIVDPTAAIGMGLICGLAFDVGMVLARIWRRLDVAAIAAEAARSGNRAWDPYSARRRRSRPGLSE